MKLEYQRLPELSPQHNELLRRLALALDKIQYGATSGATSHKIGSFTRDMSLASGTQAITGVGFQPKVVWFISALGTRLSNGYDDGSSCVCQWFLFGFTGNAGILTSFSIVYYVDSTTKYEGKIQSMDSDGFTISWTKTGSPTGTLTVGYLAFKY